LGFAPFVGRAWEDELHNSVLPSQRWVVLRTSFVLGPDRGVGAGAFAKLRKVARLGLGGRAGAGTQGMSWIHETDMNRLFERAVYDSAMRGVYIASSPNPLCQRDFMRTLRRAIHMPIGLPAFEWMVRVGAKRFLRSDPELALYGRYVIPQRLLDEGFEFQFPALHEAISEIASSIAGRRSQSPSDRDSLPLGSGCVSA
jgi:NAD dependent epimerase/dehydratase family enzyme